MTDLQLNSVSRRGILGAFAATALVAAPTYTNAFGLLKGAGDIRRIRMYSGRTGESIDTIYWIEGEYIPEVVKEINNFMRDWRTDDVVKMDPRNFDIMAAAHRLMDVNEPYMLLSGYRSPKYNLMLRKKGHEVADDSQHSHGHAVDFRVAGVPTATLRDWVKSLALGGVGYYPDSQFVHADVGPVRFWKGK